MNKPLRFLVVLSIVLICGALINATQKEDISQIPTKETPANKETKISDKNTSELYEIKALKIPKGLNFAGEHVPIEKQDIRERIDRELLVNTYWQSNGLLMFKRAHKYFPIIEPILAENGIPDDFKYLAVIESGLQNATSPAGARGFWQIMKATAKENGLEVNNNVDERYHLEKATKVACKYLQKAKDRLGSWTLAAAAYNAGNYGMAKKLESQKVNNYYDLLLGQETSRYVPRIVALKEIMSNPKKYGFVFETEDLYQLESTITVEIDTAINNIAVFAQKFGTNYKELKIHNPWLRENVLNNASRKKYEIKLPQ
ncbi:lytic transglycosylase domain-containing protein [Urechidicola croceus]|uniref:Murein transglycosylase n=1 Tax=Urechidicola croceus TaxID=1850246 RepID=A0A1D8P610_9FLAO|nr:lytic transglycosylase domain-containing protein [Urechidicola croceus]AOW19990.1 murein transglycosylase [Urechidicola croceus]